MRGFKPKMTGLLLFSHGSLLCGADMMVRSHAERLRNLKSSYKAVEIGFLNYNHPDLAEAVNNLSQAGCATIIALPYFLIPGKFASRDLPAQIETIKKNKPELKFIVGEPLGYSPLLANAILEIAELAVDQSSWFDYLNGAANGCKGNPACPLYGAEGCPFFSASRKETAAI
jgi:sirohydrochlorin cobaltochelatase